MMMKKQNYQNLWDIAKLIHRGKPITTQTHIRKKEKDKISNLSIHLKCLKNKTRNEFKD